MPNKCIVARWLTNKNGFTSVETGFVHIFTNHIHPYTICLKQWRPPCNAIHSRRLTIPKWFFTLRLASQERGRKTFNNWNIFDSVCYWKWPYIMDLPIKNGDFHDWNRRLKNHRCKSSKDMIHDVKIFEETTKATTLCPIIFGNRSKKYGGGYPTEPMTTW